MKDLLEKGEQSPMWCCGWRLLSWRSYFYGVSHDPVPGTPAREESAVVSMTTGSAIREAERLPEVVVVGGAGGVAQCRWGYF